VSSILKLSEMNKVHRAFWKEQNELRDRRLANPVLWRAVIEELNGYQIRRVEPRSQETVESLLEKADNFRQTIFVERARRAGRARKADALQKRIVEIVQERPGITAPQLLDRLEAEERGGLIQEIVDGVIHFTQPDGSNDGRSKTAPVSGLKDRLSRAKKQLSSR
jgi:hypothetical protein